MAAAAEVRELADRVERDRLVGGDLARDLGFVGVAVERRDSLVARHLAAGHRVVRRDDLAHARLEPLEVFRRERRRAVEIVIEAVFDGRPDGGLRLRKEVLDGIGQHVRRGMAQLGERWPAIVGLASAIIGRGFGVSSSVILCARRL